MGSTRHPYKDSHEKRITKLLDNNAVSAVNVDPLIKNSWLRSQKFDVGVAKHEQYEVSNSEGRERIEKMGEVMPFARTCMQDLALQISGSGYTVILSDTDGVILDAKSDPAYAKELERAGIRTRISWGEEHEGTNAIGTCIAEQRPITVHKDDHYKSCNVILTCSAAPIFDPFGNLLAVIDASSPARTSTKPHQAHTLALVANTAHAVENFNLLKQQKNQWILRFHRRKEFVGYMDDAIFSVDENGTITGMNSCALRLFSSGAELVNLLGVPLDRIFDLSFADLASRADKGSAVVWPISDLVHKRHYFALFSAPADIKARKISVAISSTSTTVASKVKSHSVSFSKALSLPELTGSDPQMEKITAKIRKVADKRISIILSGETGTGKDALALAIHRYSKRKDHAFVSVNCASIPESLIESELFGYAHGAFTGAQKSRSHWKN